MGDTNGRSACRRNIAEVRAFPPVSNIPTVRWSLEPQ